MVGIGSILSLGGSVLTLVCAIFIYIHAFKRSVGDGFLTLCVPCYILYYMFSVFEHDEKGLIIAGFFIGAVLNGTGQAMARSAMMAGSGY